MNNPEKASLPMYDWPEIQSATDRLWDAIRPLLLARGLDAPAALERSDDVEAVWQSEFFVFSQTCGWPYIDRYHTSMCLIATPVYNVPGCDGLFHRSQIVVRSDDERETLSQYKGSTVAVNGHNSQSGYQAMKSALNLAKESFPFFAREIVSGAHIESIRSLTDGHADIACIDPVSWALARRFYPQLCHQLNVLAEGPATPGLPLVCSRQYEEQLGTLSFREDLIDLFANRLDSAIKEDLMLEGLRIPTHTDYLALKTLDITAREAGHATLI